MSAVPPRLIGARAKLERAREHFAQLGKEGQAFLQSGAYAVEGRESVDEPGALEWVARVTGEPPARLASIVGDVIHNARASLDLAVWELVAANGGVGTAATCFPIAKSEEDFVARLPQAAAGIAEPARRVIEESKPYEAGNLVLYRLHRLDIADKHRLLLTVGAANRSVGFKLALPQLPGETEVPEGPTIFLRPADRLFPLRDGDVVAGISAQVRESEPITPPVVVFELAFGDEETVRGEPIRETLEELLGEVERLLMALEEAE